MLLFCRGHYPLSLSTITWTMCKTNKAKILQSLKAEFPYCVNDDFSEDSWLLVDVMTYFNPQFFCPKHLENLLKTFLYFLMSHQGKFVDFVSDCYPLTSVSSGLFRFGIDKRGE